MGFMFLLREPSRVNIFTMLIYIIFLTFSLYPFFSLHKNLIEHLNAEIVLNTITDVSIALEWLKSTFLYIRILKNPTYYGTD